jgi:hypothetical protein
MANEVKRTAPDMDAIIANAKKAGKLKRSLLHQLPSCFCQ